MITQLMNNINEQLALLNKILQDQDYFKNLEKRIKKCNDNNLALRHEIKRLKLKDMAEHQMLDDIRKLVRDNKKISRKEIIKIIGQ